MEKVLEKFGIYDLLGIWAPGAICVTYYLFTLTSFFHRIFALCGITRRLLSKSMLVTLLYTAVAYVIGVLLHELGKIAIDFLPSFDTTRVIKWVYDAQPPKKKRRWHLRIRDEIYQSFDQLNKKYKFNYKDNDPGFECALDGLKYTRENITRHVDLDHSVYALSRSLCLCFLGHFILLLAEWMFFYAKLRLLLLGVDAALTVLFYIRAYRYLYRWVKNVYIQYFYEFIKQKE